MPPALNAPGRPRGGDLPVFLAVAFGLSWLFALPLWTGAAALTAPIAQLIGVLMMATPTLGVVAVWALRHRDVPIANWFAQTSGIGLGESRRRTLTLIATARPGEIVFTCVPAELLGSTRRTRAPSGTSARTAILVASTG